MWNVSPRKMCNQHILGEHLEMHMFIGSIRKGIKLDGYISKGLVETNYIKSRHDILVKEMIRRGMTHNSPMDNFECEPLGKVNKAENEIVLSSRCNKCKELMEVEDEEEKIYS
jgi:hypothetical protein